MNYFYKLFIMAIIIFSSTQYSSINALTITSSNEAGSQKSDDAKAANAITEWNLDVILNGNMIQSLQTDSTNTDAKGRNLLHNGCHQSPCASRYGRWGHRERFNAWYEKYSQTPCPTPPTMEPTTPTVAPTVSPTVSPSVSPTLSPSSAPTGSPTARCALFDHFDGKAVNEDIWEVDAGVSDSRYHIVVANSWLSFVQDDADIVIDGAHIRTKKKFRATEAPLVINAQFRVSNGAEDSQHYIKISNQEKEYNLFDMHENVVTFLWSDSQNEIIIRREKWQTSVTEDCVITANMVFNIRVTIETNKVKMETVPEEGSPCPVVEMDQSLSGDFFVYIGGDPDGVKGGQIEDAPWNFIEIDCHEQ